MHRNRWSRGFVLFAGLVLAAVPLAGAPRLVKDFDTALAHDGGGVSTPGAAAGGVFYFTASDPAHGSELWRSDGTAAGTYRLTDVCAGPCDANPTNITPAGGHVFFLADDGFSGRELWASDGTPGSERRLGDLCPGPCSSTLNGMAAAGGRLFFTRGAPDGIELWQSDGTPEGSARLSVLCTGGCDASLDPFTAFGDRVFTSVFDQNGVLTVWTSDGTAAGTVPLASLLGPGVPPPARALPLAAGGFLFFFTQDGLWRTDLTPAGTMRLATYAALETDPGAVIVDRVVSSGSLYLRWSNGDVARSDGTPAGTGIVSHLDPLLTVYDFLPFRGGILVALESFEVTASLVWIGPAPAPPAVVALLGGFLSVTAIAPLGDRAVFLVDHMAGVDVPAVREVWITDGTVAGTRRLRGAPFLSGPQGLVSTGRLAFFVARDGGELWATDGTWIGTRAVRDFATGPGSGGPLAQIAWGGRLLFSARTSETAAPLFVSDGTPRGTRAISLEGSWADGFTVAGSRVFFASRPPHPPGLAGRQPTPLWQTDGTPAGTRLVAPGVIELGAPAALGDRLLFRAARTVSPLGGPDLELWRSDGTRHGTALVKNIDPYQRDTFLIDHTCAAESSSPVPGVALRGRLLFAADDGVHGRELWATDGTARGTRLLADINPLSGGPYAPCPDDGPRPASDMSSNPAGFVRYRGGALFTADDGTAGPELWWTDGTTAGTRRVVDLRPGPEGSAPHDLVAFGGYVYFIASAEGDGERLWRTDGTAAGTVEVHDLLPAGAAAPSWARGLLASGSRLFLVVYNEATGAELWTSEGNAASTRLVADLRPGPASAAPQQLTDVAGRLVFAADDGVHGVEPWTSDGTAAGTFSLGDIHPGRDASSPGPFTRVGDQILFGADDGAHGRELWAIPVADLARELRE